MKKIICILLTLLLMIGVPPFYSEAGESVDFPAAGYNVAQYYLDLFQQYSWYYGDQHSLWNTYYSHDESFAYVLFEEQIRNKPFAQELIAIATASVEGLDLFNLGNISESATVQYYEMALISLLKTSEMNLTEAINKQSTVDNKMTPLNYMVKAGGVFADAIGFSTNGIDNDTVKALSTLIDGSKTAQGILSATLDSANTEAELEFLRHATQAHKFCDIILGAILEYDDPANSEDIRLLKEAAEHIQQGLSASLVYKLDHFSEWFASAGAEMSDFVFGDVLSTVSDSITSSDYEFMNSETISNLKLIANVSKLVNSASSGADLAVLICDLMFGASDLLFRYYEVSAMCGVRNALLQKANTIRNKVDSWEDADHILDLIPYLQGLLYVNARGEYCMYSLQTGDAKLYTIFSDKEAVETWYNAAIECLTNCCNGISDLILDPDDYYITDTTEEPAGRWVIDKEATEAWNSTSMDEILGSEYSENAAEMNFYLDGSFDYCLDNGLKSVGSWQTNGHRIDCEITNGNDIHVFPTYTDNEQYRLMTGYNLYPIYWKKTDHPAENHMPNSDNENKPHAPNPGSDGDTSDTFKLYQAAVEKTTESGSWVEDLSMTAAMKISNGNSTTKTTATINTHSEISNYYKDDISNLHISGSADMKILNQRYSWNVTYSDGIAHYQYTEPDTTSVDLKMDPNYFNFNSLTDDMLTNTRVLGNRIEFTVPGDKMTEAGLAAVNLMNGIKNLEYGDVNVNVTLNEKGGINTITMFFDASMTYQGYDADVDYEIEYSFS